MTRPEFRNSPTLSVKVDQLHLDSNNTMVVLLGGGKEWVEIDGDGTVRFGDGEFSLNLLAWLERAREATR